VAEALTESTKEHQSTAQSMWQIGCDRTPATKSQPTDIDRRSAEQRSNDRSASTVDLIRSDPREPTATITSKPGVVHEAAVRRVMNVTLVVV